MVLVVEHQVMEIVVLVEEEVVVTVVEEQQNHVKVEVEVDLT